jgi:hypothetical protein
MLTSLLCSALLCFPAAAFPACLQTHTTRVNLQPNSWKVTRAQFDAIVAATKDFSEDSLQFMSKVLHRSGLGDETYAPPSEFACCAAVCCTVVSDLNEQPKLQTPFCLQRGQSTAMHSIC